MKYVAYALPAVLIMEYPEHTAWFPLIFGLIWGDGKLSKLMLNRIVFNYWALLSHMGDCTLGLTLKFAMQTQNRARKKKCLEMALKL